MRKILRRAVSDTGLIYQTEYFIDIRVFFANREYLESEHFYTCIYNDESN